MTAAGCESGVNSYQKGAKFLLENKWANSWQKRSRNGAAE